MCPACLSTAALILVGTTSTGGLTALVVTRLRGKTGAKSIDLKSKREQHGSAKTGVAR
jgi:hypothetical protein